MFQVTWKVFGNESFRLTAHTGVTLEHIMSMKCVITGVLRRAAAHMENLTCAVKGAAMSVVV